MLLVNRIFTGPKILPHSMFINYTEKNVSFTMERLIVITLIMWSWSDSPVMRWSDSYVPPDVFVMKSIQCHLWGVLAEKFWPEYNHTLKESRMWAVL